MIHLANNNEVSSDFIGEKHSCVLDIATCMALNTNFFKLVCWYENEYSYACRVIDTVRYFETRIPNPTVISRNLKVPVKMASERKRPTIESPIFYKDPKLKKATTFPVFLKKLSNKHQRTGSGNIKTSRRTSDFERLQEEEEEDRCILIDSCTDDGREQTSIVKAHDRLQKLKDEFRKMVNKTEDLLKKSYNNRFRSNSRAASVSDSAEGNATETGTKIGSGDNANVHGGSSIELYRTADNTDNLQMKKEDRPQITLKLIDTNVIAVEEVDTQRPTMDRVFLSSTDQNFSTIFWNPSKKSNHMDSLSGEHKSTLTNDHTFIDNRSTVFEILFDESRELLPEEVRPKYQIPELLTESGLIDPKLVTKCGDTLFEKFKKQIDVKKVDGRIEISLKVSQAPTAKPTAEKEIRHRKKKDPRIKINNIKKDLVNNPNVYHNQYTKNNTFVSRKRFISPSSRTRRARPKTNNNKMNLQKIDVTNGSETSKVTVPGISQSTSIEVVKHFDYAGKKEALNYRKTTGMSNPISIAKLNPATCSNFRPYSPIMVEIEESDTLDRETDLLRQDETIGASLNSTYLQPFNIDLYDKLETASSTNSFKSKDGKSQIISVSDLTNSLEDLRKLNKICKILEISDELSDKLLSPLSKATVEKGEKKWSFKELCETIKLDEFFDNVFGQRIT